MATFCGRYFAELDSHPEAWEPIPTAARHGRVTLVYSSHDTEHNNAVALKEYLQAHLGQKKGTLMPDFGTSRGAARAPDATAGPSLTFDLAQQIRELRQESYWQSGRNSKTLVKYDDFRIVLTALKAKTTIHEHHSAGRISVQTVEGHLRMHSGGREFDLPAGRVLVLDRALPHDVVAIEDSACLLTIAWPEGAGH